MSQIKAILSRLETEGTTSEQVLEKFGRHIRERRLTLGISIRDLAKRARCDKNTILRLERGLPTIPQIQARVSQALGTVIMRDLLFHPAEASKTHRICRGGEAVWSPSIAVARFEVPKEATFQEFEARKKFGFQGTIPLFNGLLNCQLEGGKIVPCVMEIFQKSKWVRHSGEEYLYCLQGELRVYIGKESFDLSPGDSACFWSGQQHCYGPVTPLGVDEPPVRVLSIRIDYVPASEPGPKKPRRRPTAPESAEAERP